MSCIHMFNYCEVKVLYRGAESSFHACLVMHIGILALKDGHVTNEYLYHVQALELTRMNIKLLGIEEFSNLLRSCDIWTSTVSFLEI